MRPVQLFGRIDALGEITVPLPVMGWMEETVWMKSLSTLQLLRKASTLLLFEHFLVDYQREHRDQRPHELPHALVLVWAAEVTRCWAEADTDVIATQVARLCGGLVASSVVAEESRQRHVVVSAWLPVPYLPTRGTNAKSRRARRIRK